MSECNTFIYKRHAELVSASHQLSFSPKSFLTALKVMLALNLYFRISNCKTLTENYNC